MGAIAILPENVVNRIAAGEVVERPASVARELMENAIDAKAQNIAIEILEGGCDLIRVRDDGEGMSADNLARALLRHATSKLPESADASDLRSIATLGFRGEALPAIGAVGKLAITSRAKDAPHASQIEARYGHRGKPAPAPGACGTVVELRDLFHRTPARLKFLKSVRAEAAALSDVVRRLAMAHPEIGVSLRSGKAQSLNLAPEKGDRQEMRMARLSKIMGREFQDNSVPVLGEAEHMRLSGFAGLPTYNKMGVAWQFLFVNGRPVRDRVMAGSLRAAYADLTPRGRNPVLALFLDIAPSEVDVNVHPAKAEVRFRDAQSVRGLIIRSLKQALEAAGHRASDRAAYQAVAAMRPTAAAAPAVPNHHARPSFYSRGVSPPSPPSPAQASAAGLVQPSARVFDAEPPPPSTPPSPRDPAQTPTDYPMGVAKAQLHKTYIVSETKEGFILVDQHAAHERIVHEEMKRALAKNGVERQALLVPEIVELSESEAELLAETAEGFAELGFLLERYGKSAVMLREVPLLCVGSDMRALIRDLAEEIAEAGASSVLKDKLDEISGTIACHSSIRAGRSLTAEEMNAILRKMETTPHAGQCNHGRPTYVALKRGDMEKLFERR